jgi:hypothetical protein
VVDVIPMNIRGQGIAWDPSEKNAIFGIIRATADEKKAGKQHKVTGFRLREDAPTSKP